MRSKQQRSPRQSSGFSFIFLLAPSLLLAANTGVWFNQDEHEFRLANSVNKVFALSMTRRDSVLTGKAVFYVPPRVGATRVFFRYDQNRVTLRLPIKANTSEELEWNPERPAFCRSYIAVSFYVAAAAAEPDTVRLIFGEVDSLETESRVVLLYPEKSPATDLSKPTSMARPFSLQQESNFLKRRRLHASVTPGAVEFMRHRGDQTAWRQLRLRIDGYNRKTLLPEDVVEVKIASSPANAKLVYKTDANQTGNTPAAVLTKERSSLILEVALASATKDTGMTEAVLSFSLRGKPNAKLEPAQIAIPITWKTERNFNSIVSYYIVALIALIGAIALMLLYMRQLRLQKTPSRPSSLSRDVAPISDTMDRLYGNYSPASPPREARTIEEVPLRRPTAIFRDAGQSRLVENKTAGLIKKITEALGAMTQTFKRSDQTPALPLAKTSIRREKNDALPPWVKEENETGGKRNLQTSESNKEKSPGQVAPLPRQQQNQRMESKNQNLTKPPSPAIQAVAAQNKPVTAKPAAGIFSRWSSRRNGAFEAKITPERLHFEMSDSGSVPAPQQLVITGKAAQNLTVHLYGNHGLNLRDETRARFLGKNNPWFDLPIADTGNFQRLLSVTPETGGHSKQLVLEFRDAQTKKIMAQRTVHISSVMRPSPGSIPAAGVPVAATAMPGREDEHQTLLRDNERLQRELETMRRERDKLENERRQSLAYVNTLRAELAEYKQLVPPRASREAPAEVRPPVITAPELSEKKPAPPEAARARFSTLAQKLTDLKNQYVAENEPVIAKPEPPANPALAQKLTAIIKALEAAQLYCPTVKEQAKTLLQQLIKKCQRLKEDEADEAPLAGNAAMLAQNGGVLLRGAAEAANRERMLDRLITEQIVTVIQMLDNPEQPEMPRFLRDLGQACELAEIKTAPGEVLNGSIHRSVRLVEGPLDRVVLIYRRGFRYKEKTIKPAEVFIGRGM